MILGMVRSYWMFPIMRILSLLVLSVVFAAGCRESNADDRGNGGDDRENTATAIVKVATPVPIEHIEDDGFGMEETKLTASPIVPGTTVTAAAPVSATMVVERASRDDAVGDTLLDSGPDLELSPAAFPSFPDCFFAPFGIGGDVPVYSAADLGSLVLGQVVMGKQYPVVDAGGEWQVEDAEYSGRYYQIRLDDGTIGWVQDMRGRIDGDCHSYRNYADIEFFEASPATLNQGELVALQWKAAGASAIICPITRYSYFTDDDCETVPLTGSFQFKIPVDLEPSYEPGFRLTVEGDEGTESQQGYAYVNLYCENAWFFDPGQPSGPICPQLPISSWAAVQHFEHGTMIWIETLGRYYILSPQPLDQIPLNQHGLFSQIDDPLTIVDDSSGDYTPPDGLLAPESGFGLLWRGDVAESQPLVEVLGWATAPEFGYQASFQCSDFISTQFRFTCYLSGPEDELIWMDTGYNRWLRGR